MMTYDAIVLDYEQHREPLYFAGCSQLSGRLARKIDVQGLVQDTFFEAWQQHGSWRSSDPRVRRAWIFRAFRNNLVDAVRRFHRQSRDVSRERDLDHVCGGKVGRLRDRLKSNEPSPCQRAMVREQVGHLMEALARLPETQRQAIEMHHLEGMPIREVAQNLQRSPGSVAGLIFRGLRKLRERLHEMTSEEI